MSGSSVVVQSAAEVQEIFRQAVRNNTPVYAYRHSTEGVSIDFSGLNKIVDIDADNLVAVVEPGVKLDDLATALRVRGLRYIPAESACYRKLTVGEFVYIGSPNIYSNKYGSGKFFLMGGDFVLPSGEMMSTGGKTVKNVTGYDFIRFFTGGYADLAVGVKYILKLSPLPECRVSFSSEFTGLADCIGFVEGISKQGIVPAYMLWLDSSVRQILTGEAEFKQLLAFELDGVEEEVQKHIESIERVFGKRSGGRLTIDKDGRTDGLFAQIYTNGNVLTDEFKVPWKSQRQFLSEAYELMAKRRVVSGFFGQLAEGKINLYLEGLGPEYKDTIAELGRLTYYAGGITGGKFRRLYGSCPNDKLAMLEREVKARFDPLNLFNPRREAAV